MVAHSHGPGVLSANPGADQRYGQVSRVLYQVLFLNLAVAFAKIVLGTYTVDVSTVSDWYHSLTDSASNFVVLVGISIARQPPDAEHPYGHRNYETLSSVAILIFLILALVEVVSSAADRVMNGGAPKVF